MRRSIYIRDDEWRALEAEAKRLDRTVSWVLRRAWLIARDRVRGMPGDGE
jgi:uncharacterized small protein (TIGR04563 family)